VHLPCRISHGLVKQVSHVSEHCRLHTGMPVLIFSVSSRQTTVKSWNAEANTIRSFWRWSSQPITWLIPTNKHYRKHKYNSNKQCKIQKTKLPQFSRFYTRQGHEVGFSTILPSPHGANGKNMRQLLWLASYWSLCFDMQNHNWWVEVINSTFHRTGYINLLVATEHLVQQTIGINIELL